MYVHTHKVIPGTRSRQIQAAGCRPDGRANERPNDRNEAWSTTIGALQVGCAPIGRGKRDAGIDGRTKTSCVSPLCLLCSRVPEEKKVLGATSSPSGRQYDEGLGGRKRQKQRSGRMAVSVGGGTRGLQSQRPSHVAVAEKFWRLGLAQTPKSEGPPQSQGSQRFQVSKKVPRTMQRRGPSPMNCCTPAARLKQGHPNS